MKKFYNTQSGFTLVEILVAVGILLVFLPFAASMLTNSSLLSSYSKHKIQAAYAAQQLIETQRQAAFVSLAAGQSKVIGPANVLLDTKGNYNNSNCANANVYCGTAVITITPSVYTTPAGVSTTSNTVDHVMVQIYWSEQVLNKMVPMTETYAEDIVNDPMLN